MFKKDDLSFDTMMYQIMSSINWSETTKGNVKAKIKELNEQFAGEKGVSMFGSSLAKQWKAYDSDDRYSTASLRFNSTDIETSIRNTEVVFEPTETGKEYTIDQMGDGLRSLFYISLVDSILDVECQMQKEIEEDIENTSFSRKPPILTIIALEEPENHIAPHLLGKLVMFLRLLFCVLPWLQLLSEDVSDIICNDIRRILLHIARHVRIVIQRKARLTVSNDLG